jgi:hypothetical protein
VLDWWPLGVLVGQEDGPAHFREFRVPDARDVAVDARPSLVHGLLRGTSWAFVEDGRLYFVQRWTPEGRSSPRLLVEEVPTDGRVVRVGRYVGHQQGLVVMIESGFTIAFRQEYRLDGSMWLSRTGLVGPPLDPASVRELYAEWRTIYALLTDGRVVVWGYDESGLVDWALSTVRWTELPFPRPVASIAVVEEGSDNVLHAALDDGTVWVADMEFSGWFDDPRGLEPLRRVEPRMPGRVTRLVPLINDALCVEGPDYPGGVHCPAPSGDEQFPFTTVPATAVEIDRRHDWDGMCRRYRMEDGYEEILCVRMEEPWRPILTRRWTNRR